MYQFLWILLNLQYHMSMIKLVQPFALRILDLKFCDFQPVVCVSWPKLNVWTIGYVNQSNEIIAQSLSGSHMLEFSRLQGCNGINRLIVISSNFKELLIDGPRESFSSTWFVMAIFPPNYIGSTNLFGNTKEAVLEAPKTFSKSKSSLIDIPFTIYRS